MKSGRRIGLKPTDAKQGFSTLSLLCSVLSVPLWLSLSSLGGEAPRVDVVPLPQQVTFDPGAFEIDRQTVIMVSGRASEATRRAARALQIALRERYGIDLPIVRITEQHQFGVSKDIWIVEPGENHPPANTIGAEGLTFTEPMRGEGYFIRVDMPEVVVHGASDAGTLYGVATLIQLIRPPRSGTLFRARRGPTLPCLWIADWPARAVRAASALRPPREPEGAEAYLRTLARYKLNAIHDEALAGCPAEKRIRELAPQWHVKTIVGPFEAPKPAFQATVAAWMLPGPEAVYAEALLADEAWDPTGQNPESFRLRFARATFGTDAAAEAIQLTEECLKASPRVVWPIPSFAGLAKAAEDRAKQFPRERAEHERRARRVRALWRSVQHEPALRGAFLAVAERAICWTDNAYALADAYRSYREGRIAQAARVLRARLDWLGWLGEGATETRKSFEALIARLDAAAKTPKPLPVQEVFSGGF
jgi:hypothetical protein